MNITKEIQKKIEEIILVHNITREYAIRFETLTKKTHIQVLKEFRDAYDHFLKTLLKDEGDETVIENLDCVLSHENRAFTDIMDILYFRLSEMIDAQSERNINQFGTNSFYGKYDEMFDFLNTSIGPVVKLRNGRGPNNRVNREEYQSIVDRCIEYYKEFKSCSANYERTNKQ